VSALLHAVLLFSAAAAGLSLLSVATNLLVLPRLSRARLPGKPLPPVSIPVPARDEERGVAAGVGSPLAQDYPDFEVVVVDDRSTDRTGEILRELAAANPRLRVIRGEEPPRGWLGKPHALWQAARAARGEIFLFVDADVRYHPDALREAVGFLEARGVDFLALFPRLETNGFWESVLMAYLPVSVFFGPGWLAHSRRSRWIAAGGGAGNLVRRRAYEAVGGHEALRDSVIDDIRLARTVKRAGFPVALVRAEDRLAVRMYRGFREVWDGFTKNVAYGFDGVFGLLLAWMVVVTSLAMTVPWLALFAAALGADVPEGDLLLAATAAAGYLLARLLLAAALGDPLWPALTNPLMAVVWAALIARSLFRRFVRKRLAWRGLEFDARAARF
jgi:chlorobactene glucosyltransferase